MARLNDAWGTAFWSQRYDDFEQVLPPRVAPTHANPTQQLDFRRFSSDQLLDNFVVERDVLHRISPGVPVTTNFMVMRQTIEMDYLRWGRELDVVSNDHYLISAEDGGHRELAFSADLTRGTAGGKPWLLMEHSTSAVNWQPRNRAKLPGEMIRNSLAHVARGADAVLFFQWRASRAGAEKFHSGLLPHAGTDTRQWREVVELSQLLDAVEEVAGSAPRNEAAILFDYEAWWGCELDSHPSVDVRYRDRAEDLHRALTAQGVGVDVVHPSADLSAYRLVVVPTLYLVSDATVAAIDRRGGRRGDRGGDLLQRDRRRARPHPARRLPRRLPRPPGRADDRVPAAARGPARGGRGAGRHRPSAPTPGPRTSSSPAPRRSRRTSTGRRPGCRPSPGGRSGPGRRGTSRPGSTPTGRTGSSSGSSPRRASNGSPAPRRWSR